MKDLTILTVVATLAKLIADIVNGTASKRDAYNAIQATASLLRDDLTVEALARGELAADIAEDLKAPR